MATKRNPLLESLGFPASPGEEDDAELIRAFIAAVNQGGDGSNPFTEDDYNRAMAQFGLANRAVRDASNIYDQLHPSVAKTTEPAFDYRGRHPTDPREPLPSITNVLPNRPIEMRAPAPNAGLPGGDTLMRDSTRDGLLGQLAGFISDQANQNTYTYGQDKIPQIPVLSGLSNLIRNTSKAFVPESDNLLDIATSFVPAGAVPTVLTKETPTLLKLLAGALGDDVVDLSARAARGAANAAEVIGKAEVGVGRDVFGVGDNAAVRLPAKGKASPTPKIDTPESLAAELPKTYTGGSAAKVEGIIERLEAAGYELSDDGRASAVALTDELLREDFDDAAAFAAARMEELAALRAEILSSPKLTLDTPVAAPPPSKRFTGTGAQGARSAQGILDDLYSDASRFPDLDTAYTRIAALGARGVDVNAALQTITAGKTQGVRSQTIADALSQIPVDEEGNVVVAGIKAATPPIKPITAADATPAAPPPTDELTALLEKLKASGPDPITRRQMVDRVKILREQAAAVPTAPVQSTQPSITTDTVPPTAKPPRTLEELQAAFEKAKTLRQMRKRIASLTPEERELLEANGIHLPTSGSGGKQPPIKPPTTSAVPPEEPDAIRAAREAMEAAQRATDEAGAAAEANLPPRSDKVTNAVADTVAPEIKTQIDDAAAKLTGRKPRVRSSTAPTSGSATPPTPPARETIKPAVANLVSWIKASAPLRGERAAALSEARSQRAGRGAAKLSPTGGIGQFASAGAELAGEILGKDTFTHPMGKFPDEQLDQLANYITTQPLPFYEKFRAGSALRDLTAGIPPQANEIVLLEEIFGPELGRSLTKRDWKWLALNLWNAPTSLISSMDLSNPGRQGIFLAPGHPKAFVKSWAPQLKAFMSEENSRLAYEGITNSASGKIGRAVGLDIINPMSTQGAARQEEFISNIFDDPEVFGGVLYNTVGRGVRPSNRAFVAFGNNQRHDIFASTIKNWFGEENLEAVAQAVLDAGDGPGAVKALDKALAQFAPKGVSVKGKDVKWLAEFLNDATGRANPANMAKYGPILNALFFSPRFAISRIMIPARWIALGAMNPKSGMAKELRYLIMKDTLAFTATGLGVLALLSQTKWADVDMDPRSSDFGKIRIGPHRFDFWGGFQQWIRYPAQFLTGQRKTLGAAEIHEAHRGEVAWRFLRSKLKPSVGTTIDVITGEDLTGEDIRVVGVQKEEAIDTVVDLFLKNVVPLWMQDMFEGYDAELDADDRAGPRALIGVGAPAFLGMGVTSFDTPENRIPELRIFGRREELIARKFADQFGTSPETFALLVRYYQVRPNSVQGVTEKGRRTAGEIRATLDNPELIKDFTNAADLFEDQMAAKYPAVLKQLQEDGQKLEFDPKTITDKPEPKYTANPKHKDGSITQAYAQQVLTNIFFTQLDWDVEVPEGKTTPPYNWLPPEYKATIDQWLLKANAKTYDLYGGSKKDAWWELGNTARTHVAKLVGDPEPPKGIRAHQIVKELMAEVEAQHGRTP